MKNEMLVMPAKNPTGINGKMRLGHVGLRTTDYEGTIQWYVETLGFRLLKKWSAGELQLAFLAPANNDDFWIEVLHGGIKGSHQDPSEPIISGFQHICIEVENVNEALAYLREKNVNVSREPFDVPPIAKRCAFITDLHGNVIELSQNI